MSEVGESVRRECQASRDGFDEWVEELNSGRLDHMIWPNGKPNYPELEARQRLYTPRSDRATALYRHFDDGDNLLYVGISVDPDARWKAHKRKDWARSAAMMSVEWFDNRPEAAAAEVLAIRAEKPLHNIAHNGG